MIRHNSAETANFDESVRLLCELHSLILAGLNESEAAETIRDAMEAPWWNLDAREQELFRGLSADLYSIGVDRTVHLGSSRGGPTVFSKAIEACDWDGALNALREHEAELAPADVACLRGICWANLDQADVAALFFGEALRLRPDDVRFKSMYWRALVRAQRGDEAKHFAEQALSTNSNPFEIALATDVLLDWAAEQADEQAGPVFGRIVEAMTRTTEATPRAITS